MEQVSDRGATARGRRRSQRSRRNRTATAAAATLRSPSLSSLDRVASRLSPPPTTTEASLVLATEAAALMEATAATMAVAKLPASTATACAMSAILTAAATATKEATTANLLTAAAALLPSSSSTPVTADVTSSPSSSPSSSATTTTTTTSASIEISSWLLSQAGSSSDRDTYLVSETSTESAINHYYDVDDRDAHIALFGEDPYYRPHTVILNTPPFYSSYRRASLPSTFMTPNGDIESQWSLTNNYDGDSRLSNASAHSYQSDVVRVSRTTTLNFGSPSRSTNYRHYNIFDNIDYTDVPRVSPRQFASSLAASSNIFRPTSLSVLAQPRMPLVSASSRPTKVLHAPGMADDYHINLLDWSSSNLLGVGLGRDVYIWNAATSAVTKLGEVGRDDSVTCLSWEPQNEHLFVGTEKGIVKSWDVESETILQEYQQQDHRICAMAWRDSILISGGRGEGLTQRDIHHPLAAMQPLRGHNGEICTLRWSPSNTQLASGADDKQVLIWDKRRFSKPLRQFQGHNDTVKAIAWSPHQGGLLATGGGTQDGYIRFWDTLDSHPIKSVDTQSQVCNLAWSPHSNELVSTHGYAQNDLRIWRYPDPQQVNTFKGHAKGVLYMAMSPDGRTVATGSPDESICLWDVFNH